MRKHIYHLDERRRTDGEGEEGELLGSAFSGDDSRLSRVWLAAVPSFVRWGTGEQSKNESAVAAVFSLSFSVCLGAPNSVPSSTHRPWAEREVRRRETQSGERFASNWARELFW